MLFDQMRPHHTTARAPRNDATRIFHQTISADPLTVRTALHTTVARFAGQISSDEASTLELVLAEVMNNIVEHSYCNGRNGKITLSIVRDGDGLSCSVSDDGVPLPPGCLAPQLPPKTDCEIEDLPEGGFGWYLIRDLTRDLGYRREGDCNLLAFHLPLSANPGAV